MKMLITLEHMVYLNQILHTNLFIHCPATGMQNCDDASQSINSVGRGILVNILITINKYDIF